MKKLWEWFENLKEIVYIADIDTHEMIYMNKLARENYGFSSEEEYRGKKCHDILRRSAAPCHDCNNFKLEEGQFLERQHWNSIVGKIFAVKDTLLVEGDKRYRMEIGIDLTLQAQQSEILREFRKNEEMINHALKISLSEHVPVLALEKLLKYLGRGLEAKRMYIFEEESDGTVSNTYEWCAEGTRPEKDSLRHVPFDAVRNWYDEFEKGNSVIIEDLEEIKDVHPMTYAILKPQNVHTLVVNPIHDGGRIIGFYGVDNAPVEKLHNISILFETIGHFITSVLRGVTLFKRLESMSFYDQLTGLKNRYAMEGYVSRLARGKVLGLVFADITGLKRVNDEEGHKAGDELICRCASILRDCFGQHQVFRIGGDEFCIICEGIGQKELNDKIIQIKKEMEGRQAIMAFGSVWVESYNQNFEQLLTQADGLMYQDKREYYNRPGVDRRKSRRMEDA